MRQIKILLAIIISLLILSCNVKNNTTTSGNEGANGGNGIAQSAYVILSIVKKQVLVSPQTYPEISIVNFETIIDNIHILAKEKVYYKGSETDATNDGVGTIEINSSRWDSLSKLQKQALLFHEILSIMGLEKDNYNISERLLNGGQFSNEKTLSCKVFFRERDHMLDINMRYDFTSEVYLIRANDILADGTIYKLTHGKYLLYPEHTNHPLKELVLMDNGEVNFISSSGYLSMSCKNSKAISNPRSVFIIGEGSTCERAKKHGKNLCLQQGYTKALIWSDYFGVDDACSYSDEISKGQYYAYYTCTND